MGHLHLLKPPIHRVFHGLSRTYGPIFSLKFGSQLTVAVEECFTKNDVVLAKRPKTHMSQHLDYNHSTIVSSPYGDHWRNLRRIDSNDIFASHRLNMRTQGRNQAFDCTVRGYNIPLGTKHGQSTGTPVVQCVEHLASINYS